MARVIEAPPIDEEETQRIYEWIDDIPLSRPKRNITRDFADGVMMAEVIKHFYPKLVEIHNYPQAHSVQQKVTNWNTLNVKVFRKMGFQIARTDIDNIVNCNPETIERVLKVVQDKINEYKDRKSEQETSPVVQEARLQGLARPKAQAQGQSEVRVQPANNALREKEQVISELKETIEIMENKIAKLEQLVKLKDSKIQILTNKLQAAGLS
ncbi:unnamed protein product [Blepharisma stoltei]|uniref:Calponin-homology (CH) domain-containing protein n=1 Tax=Blepharisma stoltei TaxID=1481888 RepID=A0AAU9IWN0_9CILI|nr:unnamed protein product [Blepharisma stoltei]